MQGAGIVMSVTGALILVHVENLDFQKCALNLTFTETISSCDDF